MRLFPDTKNKDLIIVKVNNQDLLKNCKEELGKNCLLGGYSVYNAIEQGYFERPSSTPKTWVERIQERQEILNSL
ncbi:MAG: hypothetical protein ACEY3M_12345 [Wolbachia sp.]